MKKIFRNILVIALCLVMIGSIPAMAITPSYAPYQGYEYNTYDESVAAPIGYLQEGVVKTGDLRYDVDLKSFTDTAGDSHDPSYASYFILDGEAGVVYKTDINVDIKSVFESFTDSKGKKVSLKGAKLIACDYSNSYFYVYKAGKIYVISSLSEVIKTIKLDNVVSLSSFAMPNEDGYDTYILAVTSDRQDGAYVYTSVGKKIGFYKIGKNITDVAYSVSSGSFVAIDTGANRILKLGYEESYDDEGNSVFEKIIVNEKIKTKADLNKATCIVSDLFDENYYIALSNEKIACVDAYTGETSFIDSSVVKKGTKVPSFKYTSLCFDTDLEKIIGFSNENGPSFSVFNRNKGYIKTKDNLSVSLSAPTDMKYSKDGYLYVLDSGNSRIIKIDKDLKTVKEIFANFYSKKYGYLSFYGALGFTVDENEKFYIADTENLRVLVADNKGGVELVILRPDEQLLDTKVPFSVTKVLVDRKDQIYVLCEAINLGAFVFDMNGEFLTYYGSNKVAASVEVILNYVKRKFMTREQLKGLTQNTPISITNFDIDDNGFIYTVTETDQSKTLGADGFTEMIRKLNFQGDNIFELSGNAKGFGDFEWDRQALVLNTAFNDIDVDNQNFVNLIDSSRGKVFQYSEEGDLVTVFGAYSNQSGTFVEPTAIESIDGKVCVLDKSLNSIIIFKPTDYVLALRKAYKLLDSSDADEALAAWSQVLKFNTNSQYPYYGMGRAYEMKGEYENAMEYFKLANAKPEYSKAYEEYRKTYVSENLWWMLLIVIAVVVVAIFVIKFLKKKLVAKEGEAFSPMETKWGLPIYVLLHPVDGFEQFRTRNLHCIPIAIGLFIAGFLVKVIEFFATGFIFNSNRPIDYDMFATIIGTIAVYVLFVISNWAICTLLNGKGRMKDILCVTAYSLTPMLLTQLICVVLSNSMTLEEQAFISIISVVGMLWSAIVLLMGMYTIHQYSFIGTVGSVILTVFGIAVMALLIMLFYTLLSQLTSFVISIIKEISLR